jgi:preprotein translocase subunit SecY
VTYFVVFVERGQRKILVNYARRQVGNKVYGGQSSHLPLKLNMAGVIPPIFASSIILLPATVVNWFSAGESMRWLKDIAGTDPGQPIYDAVCCRDHLLLLLLYGPGFQQPGNCRQPEEERRFHPRDSSWRTDGYIDKILVRLTLAGAIYITLVCCCPSS